MADLEQTVAKWLAQDPDPDTRAELEQLRAAGAAAELAERFAGRLEFGTAGIRGLLGAGPMRMNRVMVRQVTAGLARYLADTVDRARERGVIIGYDGRRKSDVFAADAAKMLVDAGFRVWLARVPVATPIAAYAVLERGAAGGIMVTASHNPPQYNGYKVYWENGAQIIAPHDEGIAAAIAAHGPAAARAAMDRPLPELSRARADGQLIDLGDDLVDRYLEQVRRLAVHPEAVAKAGLTIAYTPLHGVGGRFVEAALAAAGCSAVHTVAEQREPDGEFPTVAFPNPEEPGAMDRVLELAAQVGADLVLANDPDVDRLAVAIADRDGYAMLSGDQIGVLLADYLLSEGGDGRRMVATTIVSSQLLRRMAGELGVDYRETLTGFKWIANAALAYQAAGGRFVFGYEEALGYSVGELVRDKDGISAAVLFAELTAWAKQRGETIRHRLDAIYRRYGLYHTEQHSRVFAGSDGIAQIARLMARLRANPPGEIGGHRVRERLDLLEGTADLPRSDVLVFLLEGDGRVIMRPSGTEPKLKSYYEVREPVAAGEAVADAAARARRALASLRDAHQRLLD
jgi:phosphomannomutase